MECFDTLFQLMSLRPCTALTSYLLKQIKQHEKKEKKWGKLSRHVVRIMCVSKPLPLKLLEETSSS